MGRLNCWEYTKCGRERQCPAYPNYGRNCFAVTGTWCRGEQQGDYDKKIGKCRNSCPFFKELMEERLIGMKLRPCKFTAADESFVTSRAFLE